jgi:hypothetical protein
MSADDSSDLIQSSSPEAGTTPSAEACRLAARGPFVSGHGASGLRLAGRDLRRIAVWQLGGPMQRRVADGQRDDVPSAVARPIWYFDAADPSPSGYQDASDYSRTVRVYHVHAFPGDQRDQIVGVAAGEPGELGIPRYTTGDRVYAEFNPQSGRWEILGPAEDVWRFELKTALVSNGSRDVPSTADAYLVVYDADLGRYVRTDVEFPVADFLDRWDADPGSRGYAKRMADSQPSVGWEILTMEPDWGGSSSSSGT